MISMHNTIFMLKTISSGKNSSRSTETEKNNNLMKNLIIETNVI